MVRARKSHGGAKENMKQVDLFNHDKLFTEGWSLLEFILAGRGKITVRSNKTGQHYTYMIRKDRETDLWYVHRLAAEGRYRYLGTIFENKEFKTTRRTSAWEMRGEALEGWRWLWSKIHGWDKIPSSVSVFHEGRCGMCGLELTDPVSIKEGYGPECRKKRLRRPMSTAA